MIVRIGTQTRSGTDYSILAMDLYYESLVAIVSNT